MDNIFTANIETEEFKSHQHPFHLGTDERIAREFVVMLFNHERTFKRPIVSIALKQDGCIVDVFDGEWMNRPFVSFAEVRRARRMR